MKTVKTFKPGEYSNYPIVKLTVNGTKIVVDWKSWEGVWVEPSTFNTSDESMRELRWFLEDQITYYYSCRISDWVVGVINKQISACIIRVIVTVIFRQTLWGSGSMNKSFKD